MNPLQPPIHWHQGLFLQPQHLQMMQREMHGRLTAQRELAWPFAHGVIESAVSESALANNRVQFDRLRAIMPSGVEVWVGENTGPLSLDITEEAKALAAAPIGSGLLISLAVPLWDDRRANVISDDDPEQNRLYRVASAEMRDENTGDRARTVHVRHINAKLIAGGKPNEQVETLAVLLLRSAQGTLRIDPDFVPPCLVTRGSAELDKLLRDLIENIQTARTQALAAMQQSQFKFQTPPSGPQLENLLRLRTLNQFGPRLAQLRQPKYVPPFSFYLELRALLGELAALRFDSDYAKASDYRHNELGDTFKSLARQIRELLQPPKTENYERIIFAPAERTAAARITVEQIRRHRSFYLAVTRDGDAAAVVNQVQNRDEFCLSADTLVGTKIHGMQLLEVREPVENLPPRPSGTYYFRLDLNEPVSATIWQTIEQRQAISIWSPSADLSRINAALLMPY